MIVLDINGHPVATRKREIGRYLMEKDAILPIGGLLNARAQDNSDVVTYGELLQFEEESTQNGISFGKLTIPDESLPLWIVDMQHRLGGFEWAIKEQSAEYLGNFPLVVTISDGLSKIEELDQFDIINSTQKKVRTDLARRLKAVLLNDFPHFTGCKNGGPCGKPGVPLLPIF